MRQGNFFRFLSFAIIGGTLGCDHNFHIPMPSPTPTVAPTATSEPTARVIPTSTPAPTLVPTEFPSQAPTVIPSDAFLPPSLWFWNFGCKAPYKVAPKRYQMECDSTQWYRMSSPQPCGGAPSCDKDHFACEINKTACGNQDWDDVRGPLITASGPGFVGLVMHSNPFGFTIKAGRSAKITIKVGPRADFNHNGIPVPVNGGSPGDTKGFLTKVYTTPAK